MNGYQIKRKIAAVLCALMVASGLPLHALADTALIEAVTKAPVESAENHALEAGENQKQLPPRAVQLLEKASAAKAAEPQSAQESAPEAEPEKRRMYQL